MFLIKAKGRAELFRNEKEDDFLRFMPKHFNCQPGEISVWYFDADQKREIEGWFGMSKLAQLEDGAVKLVETLPPQAVTEERTDPETGEKTVVTTGITQPTAAVVKVLEGEKLSRWPYDGEKFLGNLTDKEIENA